MDSNKLFELCLKEIDVVQNNIARFDQNGLKIKSWCITIWSAILAYSLKNKDPLVPIIAIIIVLGFGCTELTYRRFQRRFIMRSAEIEQFLATRDLSDYQYLVNKSAITSNLRAELKFTLSQSQFTIFYLMLFMFAIICECYLLIIK